MVETELSRVVDALPDLIWTAGADGSVEFLSERWFDYTGVRPENALGTGWTPCVEHAMRDRGGAMEYIAALQHMTQRRLASEALSRVRSGLARVARVARSGALAASITREVSRSLAGIFTNSNSNSNSNSCISMLAAEPSNTGAGADPHVNEQIFQAFYTTKSTGMGIGLSVSRSIIDSRGGALWALDQQAPGNDRTNVQSCLAEGC